MRVVSRHIYAAPPDVVFAMLTTPEALTEKYRSLGHRDIEILEHGGRGRSRRVRSRRRVPMTVPGFARRFFSPLTSVEQVDEWGPANRSGERVGTWMVSSTGVPVTAGGALRLVPAGDEHTEVEIIGDIECGLPLVGGRLASFVAGDVERTIRAEEAFNDAYLARRVRGRSS